jgi:3-oxoacyl-[acyl-carrier protein] reductase
VNEGLLQGKVALVTGSYQKLGAVTAETLASFGAHVIIADLLPPDQDAAGAEVMDRIRAQGVEAHAISADLAQSAEVRQLCRRALAIHGRIDILVNSAGPFNTEPYLKLREEQWDQIMNVNVKAIYLTAQELAPQMKANGWGRIVNMCAGSAFVRNHNVYTLAKVAVQTITESLALELGPEITVNAIAPGQIVESLPEIHRHDPTFGDRYRERAPTKRLISRREVAEMIAMMCTPPFANVTGVTMRMDGGAELPRF